MKQAKVSQRLLLTAVLLGAIAIQSPAHAKTQDKGKGSDILSDITSLISDAEGYFNEIKDFVTELPGQMGDFLEQSFGQFAPDFESLVGSVMGTDATKLEAGNLSNTFESVFSGGDGKGSFSARQDMAKLATRDAALKTMSASTLSKEAQERMAQVTTDAEKVAAQNGKLAQKSSKSDVTQHIMQNVSEQLALNAKTSQQLLVEEQQARVDRAIANVLTAQVAQELTEANTADRREAIAASAAAANAMGLIALPGGYTIEKK
jgi:phage-related protein